MKPLSHVVFSVATVTAVLAVFVPDAELSLPVILLAAVSGFLPDFDHRKWIWKLISVAAVIGLFLFFSNLFDAVLPGDGLTVLLVSAGVSLAFGWILYVKEPLHVEFADIPYGKIYPGSGTTYLVLYTLIVFAATDSPLFALVAFAGYASHWVLDEISWQTRFGRRFLIGRKDWSLPFAELRENDRRAAREKRALEKEKAGESVTPAADYAVFNNVAAA
jgi:hypothetical protein